MLKVDISSQKFGRLTVISRAENIGKKTAWNCVCECGSLKVISTSCLRSGHILSCGCLNKEIVRALATKRNTVHGHNKAGRGNQSPTWHSWSSMRKRCTMKSHRSYKDYGGRGITVCERWSKFENFLEDMGERPEGKTLDRIDVNGNYEPANCRWATLSEQQKNKRGSDVLAA